MNLGQARYKTHIGLKLQRIWKTVEGSNISAYERNEISMLLNEVLVQSDILREERDDLESENSLQSKHITDLENEVSSLKDETNDDADEWDPFSEDENEFEEEFDLSEDIDREDLNFSGKKTDQLLKPLLDDNETASTDPVMKALEALDAEPPHSMKIDPVAFDREMKKHPKRGRNKKS